MVIITGLGRCGTSFLIKYLKEVGFGVGKNVHWHNEVRAGLELSTFYSIIDWMHYEYCKKGKKINLNDQCKCEYWNGYTYREALENVDKDEKQGKVDVVKDPRITWHPDIIEAIWKARKDIYLLICHREVEDIYKSRKSLPIQYDDPKPRKEIDEYKIDFSDFYTRVLNLGIKHSMLFFPNFLYDFRNTWMKIIDSGLYHDMGKGKEIWDEIVDRRK